MADESLPEVTVTGTRVSTSSDYDDNWWKIQEAFQRAVEAAGAYSPGYAFAPPVPLVLPEVPFTPAPAPAPTPPPVVAPTKIITKIVEKIPILGILVPLPGGPPGTGDAPDDPSTITDRYPPPPKPPEIPVTFAEPELPPNWWDIANRPYPGDPIVTPGMPIPYPEVEMPPGEKFFDVSPPQPTTRSRPYVDTITDPFFFPAGSPYDFPLAYPSSPGPGSAPAPLGTPGSDPAPGYPDPFLLPDWRLTPQPGPANPTAPDLFGAPLPDVFGDPIGDPFPAPERPAGPRPDPGKPGTDARPRDVYTPVAAPFDPFADWADPDVTVDPFPDMMPQPFDQPNRPPNKADPCNCAQKKPKKNKPKPRTECWKGTYQQLAKGIVYHRKEQVPCESAAPKKTPKRKPGKTQSLPDLARDIFNFNL